MRDWVKVKTNCSRIENLEIKLEYKDVSSDSESTLQLLDNFENGVISNLHIILYSDGNKQITNSLFGIVKNSTLYNVDIDFTQSFIYTGNGLFADEIENSILNHVGIRLASYTLTIDSNTAIGLIVSRVNGNCEFYGLFVVAQTIQINMVNNIGFLIGENSGNTNISYSFVNILKVSADGNDRIGGFVYDNKKNLLISNSFIIIRETIDLTINYFGGFIYSLTTDNNNVKIQYCWTEYHFGTSSNIRNFGGYFGLVSVNSNVVILNTYEKLFFSNKIVSENNNQVGYLVSETSNEMLLTLHNENSYLYINYGNCGDYDNSINYIKNQDRCDISGELLVYSNCDTFNPSQNVAEIVKKNNMQDVKDSLRNFNIASDVLYYDGMVYYSQSNTFIDNYKIFEIVDITDFNNPIIKSVDGYKPLLFYPINSIFHYFSWDMYYSIHIQINPKYNFESNEVTWSVGSCENIKLVIPTYFDLPIKQCFNSPYPALNSTSVVITLSDSTTISIPLILSIPIKIEADTNQEWYDLIYSGNTDIVLTKNYAINMTNYNPNDMISEYGSTYFRSLTGEGENTIITLLFDTKESLQIFPVLRDCSINHIYFNINVTNADSVVMNSIIKEVINSRLYDIHIILPETITIEVSNNGILASSIVDSTLIHVGVEFYTINMELPSTSTVNGLIASEIKGENHLYGIFAKGDKIIKTRVVSQAIHYFGGLFGSAINATTISYSFVDIDSEESIINSVEGLIFARTLSTINIIKSFVIVRNNQVLQSGLEKLGSMIGESNESVTIRDSWIDINGVEIKADSDKLWYGGLIASMNSPLYLQNSHLTINKINAEHFQNTSYIASSTNQSPIIITNSYLHVKDGNSSITYNNNHLDVYGMLHVYFDDNTKLPTNHYNISNLHQESIIQLKPLNNFKSFSDVASSLYYEEMIYYDGSSIVDKNSLFGDIDMSFEDNKVKYSESKTHPIIVLSTSVLTKKRSYKMETVLTFQQKPTYNGNEVVEFTFGSCKFSQVNLNEQLYINIKNCLEDEIDKYYLNLTSPNFILLEFTIIKPVAVEGNEAWYNLIYSGNDTIYLNQSVTINMDRYNIYDMMNEDDLYFESMIGKGENTFVILHYNVTDSANKQLNVFPITSLNHFRHLYFKIEVEKYNYAGNANFVGGIFRNIESTELYDIHIVFDGSVGVSSTDTNEGGIVGTRISNSTLFHVGIIFDTIKLSMSNYNYSLFASEVFYLNSFMGLFVKGNTITETQDGSTKLYSSIMIGSIESPTIISDSFVDIKSVVLNAGNTELSMFCSMVNSDTTIERSYSLVRNGYVINTYDLFVSGMIGYSYQPVIIRDSWVEMYFDNKNKYMFTSSAFIFNLRNISTISHSYVNITNPLFSSLVRKLDSSVAIFNNTYINLNLNSNSAKVFIYCMKSEGAVESKSNVYGSITIISSDKPTPPTNLVVTATTRENILKQPYSYILGYYTADTHIYSSYLPFYDGNRINETYATFYSGDIMYDDNDNILYNHTVNSVFIDTNIPRYAIYPESLDSYYIQLIPHNSSIGDITLSIQSLNEDNCIIVPSQSFTISNILPYSTINLLKTECVLTEEALTVIDIKLKFTQGNVEIQNETLKLSIINKDSNIIYFDTLPEEVLEGSDFTMQLQMPIAQNIDCKWNEINDNHAKLVSRANPLVKYTPQSSANYYYTIQDDNQSTPRLTFNCSGNFTYPLTTEVKPLETTFTVNITDKQNNTINVILDYADPQNQVAVNISLMSKPYEPVTFKYECDENISCSETNFTLDSTEPHIITITQLNNSYNYIRFDIMMNLTTEDINYMAYSPYNLSVLLENVTLEYVYNYSIYDNIAFERNLTLFFNLSNDEPVDDVTINLVCPEKLICSESIIILNNSQTNANMTVSQEDPEEGVVVNENMAITINSDDHRFKRPTYNYPIIFHNYFYPTVVFEPAKLEFNPYNNKSLPYNLTIIGNPIYPINITIPNSNIFNLSTHFVTLNKENNFRTEIKVDNNNPNEVWTTLLTHTVDQDEESLVLYDMEKEANYNISNLQFDTSDAPKVLLVNVSDYEGKIIVSFDIPCFVGNDYVQSGDNCNSLYTVNLNGDKGVSFESIFKPSCSWINNQTFEITYTNYETLYFNFFTPATNLTIKPNYIRKSSLGDKTTEGSYNFTYMAPMIESAGFIDGKTIDVIFTKEYEDLKNTTCELFSDYNKFGVNSKCTKVDLNHMIIDLGENFTVSLYDPLELNVGYIKRIPNPVVNIFMTGFGIYTIEKSSQLPLLNPKINLKPKVLACEVLNLTGIVTYTSDISHPVNYLWNVSNIDTNIQSFSNNNSVWLIQPFYLNNDTNYNVKLSVDSFLHDTESVNSNVFYSKEDFILLELEETKPSTEQYYLTSRTYRIFANAELKTCKETQAPITVNWEVFNEDKKSIVTDGFELLNDGTVLQIEKHKFNVGTYLITCNATSGNILETQSITIQYSYSPLQVSIDKNYYQVYNYSDNFTIKATVVDEDNLGSKYAYTWTIGNNIYNNNIENVFSSAYHNLILEEGEYVSSVQVNDLTHTSRSASYEFIIKIDTLMFYVDIISSPSNKLTFAPTDIFKLTAVITPEDISTTDLTYEWSFVDKSIFTPIISKIDKAVIYVSCENITSTEAQYVMLTVSDGDFDITAYYKFYVVDRSISIDVQGSSNNYTFPETYSITAGDWRAINLKYRFAVLIDDEIQYLQSEFSENQVYNGVLPVGSVLNDFELYLVVFIEDEYGSITQSIGNHPIYSTGRFSNELMTNYTITEVNGQSKDNYYVKVSTLSTLLHTVCSSDTQCLNNGKCINGYCNCTEEYFGEMCQNHIPIDGITTKESKTKYTNETGCTVTTYSICASEPQYGGKACDTFTDVKPADISVCNTEIDTSGTWSNWTDWSKCSGYCTEYNGDSVRGVQSRTRKCLSTESNVTCDGDIAEYQNCSVVCISPYKLCPGQYVTQGTGEVIGNECSGHGKCIRTDDTCGESEPNCHSICVCNSGFNGSSCQYTTNDYNTILEFKSNITKLMNETIYSQSLLGSFELQSKALHSLMVYPIDLSEDDVKAINDLLFHFVSETGNIINNNEVQSSMPSDLIVNIVKTTSLIMDNEWNQHLLYVTNDTNVDSNITQAPTISPVTQYGINYPELYKQMGVMYTKSLYAPPLTVTTSAVSVEFIKADEAYIIDPVRYIGDSSVELTAEKITENKDSTIVISSWLDNPDPSSKNEDAPNSNYVAIEVVSPNTRASKANDGSTPSVVHILQRLTKGADLRHIQCTPTNDTINGAMRLVVVGIISNEGGSRYLICAGTKIQNKFTSSKKDISPKINEVGDLQEAALKIDFKGDYTFVLIVTIAILFIGIILIFAFKCYDYKEFERLEDWQSFSFMRFGYFVDNEDWETGREKDFTDHLIFNFRNHHSWLSPSCTTVKELTIVNRHQRVIVLLCEVLTSCAVNAGLYASSERNTGQLAFSMIVSSLAMLPATIILPYLYKYANNYSSATVKRKLRGIVTCWKKLKGFFRRHAKNTLFYLQAGLITTDLAYNFLNAIFFIAFLCLLPSGYFSIVFAFLFVVFLLETSSLFVVVSDQKKCQISSLIIFNTLLLMVYIIAIVIYCVLWNDTTSATYSIWKTWTSTPGFDELLKYVETHLECCGYNTIIDYNMTDCTTPFILAQGGFPSCKTRLHDTLNDWAGLYITYFVLSAVILLLKIVLLFIYVSFKIEIVLPDLDVTAESSIKPGDMTGTTTMNSTEADPDGSVTLKIVLALRKSINLVRTKRKKEYLSWRRERKLRAFMVVLANLFMFCYVVIMTFVTLLYGLTYTREQSQYWAISLLGSLLIAILIQEPTAVLVQTAAEKGITALDRSE